MQSSIALSIQETAKNNPQKIAVIVGNEKCTYENLALLNRKSALFLEKNGIKAGDRVIVEADHILDYVYLWYGIQFRRSLQEKIKNLLLLKFYSPWE